MQDEFLDVDLTFLIQVGESSVVGVLVVEGVAAQPSAGGILVEVVARLYAGVEVGCVEAFVLCAGTEHGNSREGQKDSSSHCSISEIITG